jgi:uncharacterized protein (TIGR02271 family)
MSIGKKIVGTFNSEQEVMYAIEGLKRQGHRETDMMVVAENRNDIPWVTSRTGVMVEAGTQQVSSLAGVMMDSFFTMMTAGMGGGSANTNTLSNRLIERGLPEFTAKQCEVEINKGKLILLVDTNRAYDNPVYDYTKEAKYQYDYPKEVKYEYDYTQEAKYDTQESRAVQLHEEQLDITKERVQVGELQLHKEVVEEQRTVHVPYMREEVYVERRPVIDGKYDGSLITEDEVIRIPITEERIEVTKRPVVVEEVIVGKRRIQETKHVQDTIRKEEARIERSVPSVRQEVYTESPNILIVEGNADIASAIKEDKKEDIQGEILIVEGNPDIASVIKEDKPNVASAIKEDKKEDTRAKRTGSLAVQGEKNKTELSVSKQDEPSATLTNSSDKDKDKDESKSYVAVSAGTQKDEEIQNNQKSSSDERKKKK